MDMATRVMENHCFTVAVSRIRESDGLYNSVNDARLGERDTFPRCRDRPRWFASLQNQRVPNSEDDPAPLANAEYLLA